MSSSLQDWEKGGYHVQIADTRTKAVRNFSSLNSMNRSISIATKAVAWTFLAGSSSSPRISRLGENVRRYLALRRLWWLARDRIHLIFMAQCRHQLMIATKVQEARFAHEERCKLMLSTASRRRIRGSFPFLDASAICDPGSRKPRFLTVTCVIVGVQIP